MPSHPLEGCFLSVALPDEKLVAIVQFRDDIGPVPQNPAVLLQVTIDPANLSRSERFIRFGAPGDEIVGWQNRSILRVVEVLGVLQHDGKTVKVWQQEGDEIALESGAA